MKLLSYHNDEAVKQKYVDRALAHIAAEPDSTIMDYKTIHRAVAKACEVAEREHVNPHRFRHAFAHLVLDETKDIRFVAQALGHSDVKTTMRYTVRDTQTMERGIENAFRRKS